jgi:hypothetical protein
MLALGYAVEPRNPGIGARFKDYRFRLTDRIRRDARRLGLF